MKKSLAPARRLSPVLLSLALAGGCASHAAEATLRIRTAEHSSYRIPAFLTGKFCEHLGANIYHGMDAQILRNPTFADWPFWTGQMTPDGVTTFQFERDKIEGELRRQATRQGWPESELADLVAARNDGLACFWGRVGPAESVKVSPDTGPQGGRAQRIEVKDAGQGIAQWTWLPLHRTRRFEFEIMARSPDHTSLTLTLSRNSPTEGSASARIDGLSDEWQKLRGTLEVNASAPADVPYRVTLGVAGRGQLVIRHFFLWPADHVHGADPDVIRMLKESRLPLLRWPGGNFVSGYHWEDGVGAVERRPTLPNYAWGGVEPNTFGTDEFIAFCRAVGCEPMVCVNAGSGSPEEAARWIEYCNGPASSPMGARRATNGHPEPFNIRHWEVGNELWGRWQFNWTTAPGYVDRYHQFEKAMRAADPTIQLYACGAPVLWGKDWNDTLITGAAPQLRSITDHPLVGGDVPRLTDPLDVFRDFMLVPDILERKWADLSGDLTRAGVKEPRLAVTELQLFAHLGRAPSTNETSKLDGRNLVNPGTLAEALYDTLIYHAAVRLQPFVELVTHSATVNHGGGLRKERERVYANPCHYANAMFAEFASATPVASELRTPTEQAPIVLPDIRNAGGGTSFGVVDAVAALAPDGELLVSVVQRGTGGPVRLAIQLEAFGGEARARVRTLAGQVPWAANSLGNPDAIKLSDSEAVVRDGVCILELPPYSLVRVRLTKGKP
jgi:alpha-L-arabinofuranosidase